MSGPGRRFCLIINPASGGGDASARGIAVARLLRDAGAETAVHYSKGLEHTRHVASGAAERGDVVVAVGGDGMARSVAASVVAGDGALGLVPGGRGNDLARQLGLSTDVDSVAATLLHGTERRIDVIEAAGTVVLGSVYAGVDSLVSEIVNASRWVPRRVQYQVGAVRGLLASSPHDYRVTVDGDEHRFRGYSVIVANSGFYGSGMHVAPAAVIDDGWLDVVMLGAESKLTLLTSMPKLYDGSHVDLDAVTVMRGRSVTIHSDGVRAFADGDDLASLPVTAEVRPGAMGVLG